MSTTAITFVDSQNGMDLRSSEQNEMIHLQLERVSDVTEEDSQESTSSLLTGPRVGTFMVLST